MSETGDHSDIPEEFTSEQGFRQDEMIRKTQKENSARIVHERKERRRNWAQKKTPREKMIKEETHPGSFGGLLPSNIVEHVTSLEKKLFNSDSEEEELVEEESIPKKKKAKKAQQSGIEEGEHVCLKNIKSGQFIHDSSLEFLRKRKMQVPRSTSVLNNSNQALRLLSGTGLL